MVDSTFPLSHQALPHTCLPGTFQKEDQPASAISTTTTSTIGSKKIAKRIVNRVGFEPTQITLLAPEASALTARLDEC